MGEIVTYLGPTNPKDPTDVYTVPGDPGKVDLRLPKGITVSDVPAEVAKQLGKTEGHRFKIGEPLQPEDVPPFAGYDLMDADTVLANLDNPNVVGTAVMADRVASYEAAHENRSSVVKAARHQAEMFMAGVPQPADDGLDRLVKADLHKLADDHRIEYDKSDTNDELVSKLREAQVTAESPSAEEATG